MSKNDKHDYDTRSKRKFGSLRSNGGEKKRKRKIQMRINNDYDSMDDFIVNDSDSSYIKSESESDEESSLSDRETSESSFDEDELYDDSDDYHPRQGVYMDPKLKSSIVDGLRSKIMANVKRRLREQEEDESGEDTSSDEEEEKKKHYKKKLARYFNSLPKEKQEKYKKTQAEIKDLYKNVVPLTFKVLDMDTTVSNKAAILQRVEAFEKMKEGSEEYPKLLRWVNSMKLLPFGKYHKLRVGLNDGEKKISGYLDGVYKMLDKKLYGQYIAKNKLMQIIAQWISNPKSQSSVLALEGPPGVGKTSLIKHGLSKALDLPFSFIALGGSNDISTFTGHGYTYEGATYGDISAILIKSQCMNPIIFMDELDKVSSSEKGKEIIGMLTHLTDPTQNSSFVDKYFDGIEMDLSKVFFVFSFNDIKLIDPILRDRLNVIKFDSYGPKDKKIIVKNYIFPEILKNIGLDSNDVLLSDENISYVINRYTGSEKGVRNLKRCLEEIVLKLNLIRFVKIEKSSIVFPFDIDNIDTTFPIVLTNDMITNLLKNYNKDTRSDFVKHLYV